MNDYKELTKKMLDTVRYDYRHWTRPAMYESCSSWLGEIDASSLNALEISPGWFWQQTKFRSYISVDYPDFDICEQKLDQRFDLIIADQVWEHLLWPYRATKNVFDMLNPGGYFLVTTPFLIRRHAIPHDCTRWTETGMKYFLAECGFPLEDTRTASWGNRRCVKANFNKWARKGWFGSMKNEPDFPVSVWALARKPEC